MDYSVCLEDDEENIIQMEHFNAYHKYTAITYLSLSLSLFIEVQKSVRNVFFPLMGKQMSTAVIHNKRLHYICYMV